MATPSQSEFDRRMRRWVANYLGDGANPVLYGGDVLTRPDSARVGSEAGQFTPAGGSGSGLNATVMTLFATPIGGPHRSRSGDIWHDMEAEYSVQFFWHGKFGTDGDGVLKKQEAQSEAASFSLWCHTAEAREWLQSNAMAFIYVVQIDNLTDLAVTEAERQDRAGVTIRIGYTQQHEDRPPPIESIAESTDSVFDSQGVYDLIIDDLDPSDELE